MNRVLRLNSITMIWGSPAYPTMWSSSSIISLSTKWKRNSWSELKKWKVGSIKSMAWLISKLFAFLKVLFMVSQKLCFMPKFHLLLLKKWLLLTTLPISEFGSMRILLSTRLPLELMFQMRMWWSIKCFQSLWNAFQEKNNPNSAVFYLKSIVTLDLLMLRMLSLPCSRTVTKNWLFKIS